MSNKVTSIRASEIGNYIQLRKVNRLLKHEDVATVIAVYMDVRATEGFLNIKDLYTDGLSFVFSISDTNTGWDLLEFLNKSFDCDAEITGANIGAMFPSKDANMNHVGIDLRDMGTGKAYSYRDTTYSSNGQATSFTDTQTGKTVTIPSSYTYPHREFIVGRGSKGNEGYTIKDTMKPPQVSRTHCKLYYKNNVLTVEDSNSNNGTYLNGQRIASYVPTELKPGDRLKLAYYELIIQ